MPRDAGHHRAGVLRGRYAGTAYGQSKLAAERPFARRGAHRRRGAGLPLAEPLRQVVPPEVQLARWPRSATRRERRAALPVDDPSTELELLYIDDLVSAMLGALLGEARRCGWEGREVRPDDAGPYRHAPGADRATLGEIVGLLESFRDGSATLSVPDRTEGSSQQEAQVDLPELLRARTASRTPSPQRRRARQLHRVPAHPRSRAGLRSTSRSPASPRATTGTVEVGEVPGRVGRVRQAAPGGRRRRGEPVPGRGVRREGLRPAVVEMIPGYDALHREPLRDRDLVTVMWANEPFDPERPDTYFEEVYRAKLKLLDHRRHPSGGDPPLRSHQEVRSPFRPLPGAHRAELRLRAQPDLLQAT